MDTFICGECGVVFHDINTFVTHKNEGCKKEVLVSIVSVQEDSEEQVQQGDIATVSHEQLQPQAQHQEECVQIIQPGQQEEACLIAEYHAHGQAHESEKSTGQFFNVPQIHLVPLEEMNGKHSEEVHGIPRDFQMVVKTTADPPKQSGTGRRRGRPKKGQEKVVEKPVIVKKEEKVVIPERDRDGKLHCQRCKKSFNRERHFLTHKCMATSDYVDITKKDLMVTEGHEDEDFEEEEKEEDTDPTADFKIQNPIPGKPKKGRGRPPRTAIVSIEGGVGADIVGNACITELSVSSEIDKNQDLMDEKKEHIIMEGNVVDQSGDVNQMLEKIPEEKVDCLLEEPLVMSTDQVPDVPVFQDEEEKLAFDESLNVDLSIVDGMFRVHVIPQNTNEYAPPPASRTTNELTIFSCNTCDKVFKTMSHMRLHCLIHTNEKPFKCPKCDYTSNSKGNLYTHMRKHTGAFYRCSKCDFKSVNKAHLVEHEATHSTQRHKCDLCKKTYNTSKSLVNHVRKYHAHTKAGKEYLAKFKGKHTKGTAVLHQCHICNRKFKKKIDRDRHLFAHDIKDNPNIHTCELCDYAAARRIYLEKHYRKHRVVYTCSQCASKFPSSVSLIAHLANIHEINEISSNWGEIFQSCIEASMFLPEPDGSTDDLVKPYEGQNEKVTTLTNPGLETESIGNPGTETEPIGNPGTETEPIVNPGMETQSIVNQGAENPAMETQSVVDSELETQPVTETSMETEPTADPQLENTVINIQPSENMEMETQPIATSLNDTQSIEDNVTGDTVREQIALDNRVDNPVDNPDQNETIEAEMLEHEPLEGEEDPEDDPDPDYDVFKQLNFCQMTMETFEKLRATFGSEECEYCGRLFYSKSDYEPHVRTHTGQKPYACDQCDFRAVTKDNLKRHVEKDHDRVKYVCNQCDFVANSRTQLWHHQQKHKFSVQAVCPECNIKFDGVKRLKIHLTMRHPNMANDEVRKLVNVGHKVQGKLGKRSHKCPYCPRTFMRANSDLQKHIWIHEGIKPFKCPICPHACRSKNNLQAHMLKHSNAKPFICPECGKGYKSRTALRWHVRTHKEGKLFKCTKCSYEASQKSHLVRHMETHDVVKRFICEHCDYSANTLGYMKIHYTRHHKGQQYTQTAGLSKNTPTDTKVYRCLSCDYLFGNLSDMKRHLKIRHHLQIEDMRALENLETHQNSQIIPADSAAQHIPQSEIQVVQVNEAESAPREERQVQVEQTLQYQVQGSDLDEKTASAVNILQQIIDMSQQGAFQQQQQIHVQSDGQSLVAVNPDTIIVQQDGEEVVVTSNSEDQTGQYVIQYVTAEEAAQQQEAGATVLEAVSNNPAEILQNFVAQGSTVISHDGTHILPDIHSQTMQDVTAMVTDTDGNMVEVQAATQMELQEAEIKGETVGQES